jgi:DNA-binding CsgD family transcriptional regulator
MFLGLSVYPANLAFSTPLQYHYYSWLGWTAAATLMTVGGQLLQPGVLRAQVVGDMIMLLLAVIVLHDAVEAIIGLAVCVGVIATTIGMKGIALKDSDPEIIINGMKAILAGGKWFEHSVTEPALQYSVDKPSRTVRSDDLLTKREMEIVELVCLGLRNRQIADRCALTEGTVKIHLNSVYRKLGVASRAELIVKREGMRSTQS